MSDQLQVEKWVTLTDWASFMTGRVKVLNDLLDQAMAERVEAIDWDKALEYVATRVPIDAPKSKALASLYDFLVVHNMIREAE